jgi:hypothetical protein
MHVWFVAVVPALRPNWPIGTLFIATNQQINSHPSCMGSPLLRKLKCGPHRERQRYELEALVVRVVPRLPMLFRSWGLLTLCDLTTARKYVCVHHIASEGVLVSRIREA